ncbi:centrosomal protein of 290 kDa-like [Stylophora pistillata]|uniref:Centrosomal protein of 290 kDa n=1 Tax=Stylophora pistillata TaxID=50429 RepID=A0A2B4S748_STYPI|nr:centrosomal protein of 290 kDa-like [Stylophora pistillata]PFX25206.1 Centrosomal protein of 290 kDa [Stylophora pistillata]
MAAEFENFPDTNWNFVQKCPKMSMPDVHNCLYLSSENERIRKKYKKLARRNGVLERELNDLKEQFTTQRFMQTHSRSVQVQTEEKRKTPAGGSAVKLNQNDRQKKPVQVEQFESTTKVLSMHNNLMKRYQKELKTNTAHVEQIATLSLENRDLEKKLQDSQRKIDELHKENEALQARINAVGIKERLTPSKRDLMADLRKVSQERDRIAKERKKFKDELKMLDRGFFEEVEDLKYALQQAARLNSAYEKALRQLCSQYGLSFPKVTTPTQRRRKRTRSQAREFTSQ